MKNEITWGIMGAANIAHRFCEAVKNNGGAVGFIASSDERRARAFAERHGIKRFGGYDGLLNDGEVSAVYICGTNEAHCGHTLRALRAGKHVLVEKPAAVDTGEWREMTAAARDRKLFLMEAMWSLFLPFAAAARDSLPKIGRLRLLECDFCGAIPTTSHSGLSRAYALKNYGGGLLDLGVYAAHFFNHIMNGAPETVTAAALLNAEKTDSLAVTVMKYGNALAVARTAIDFAKPCGAILYGETGVISLPAFPAPQTIVVKTSGGEETIGAAFPGNGFEPQILHAEECIARGTPESPILTHQTTADALFVLEQAMRQIGYGVR